MSFPRKHSVAHALWVALLSRFKLSQSTASKPVFVVEEVWASSVLKILPTTIFSTLVLFWTGSVQANVSYSAAPIQQPSNPVTAGTEVSYGVEAVADSIGASQIDIFINVNGVNQSAQFTSQTSDCTLNGSFFSCGSRTPLESGGAVFSWNAPEGTSNIEFELFCLHSDQTDCTGDTTSISTEAVAASSGELNISEASVSVNEGDGTATVTVARTGGTAGVASVDFSTAAGTATEGGDYTAASGTLSWTDGETGSKTIQITIIDDTEVEGDETLSVLLTNAQGASLGTVTSGTVSIQDNDTESPGTVQFDTSAVNVNENDGTATLSVSRTGSTGAASVNVGASGGSAISGDDYDFSSTTLSWADGESGSKSFTVSLVNDDSVEENETLVLNLSNPSDGLSVGTISSLTMTIQDDDDSGLNPIEEAMKEIANGDPQQEAVAQSIATICPQGVAEPQLQSDCNALVGSALSADGSANTEASLVLQQITVDDAGAAVEVSESGVANQQRNLVSRLNALRGGARGLDLSGLNFNIDGKNLSTAHLPSHWVKPESERGGSAGDDESSFFGDKVGVFIGGTISVGDKDKTDNEDGFEFETQGLTLGVDYRMTEQTILGAALGYTRIDTDIDNNGGSLDTDGISLSLYGTSYQSDQFFVEGIMTFGKNDFDQQRNINYTLSGTSVSQVASSDYDGDQFSLALGGGYHFQYSEVTLTTTGRVEYVDTTVDSYNESMSNPNTDGGGWGVALDEQTMDSLTLTLGVDASYAVSRSWGILSPQASIEWVHEFEDDSRLISASFVGDPTQDKFLLPTDSVDSDYFNLRLGVSGQFVSGGSAYIFYQKLLGYDDLDVDSIGLGFRWAF